MFNVNIPIVEFNDDGSIKPNMIFHRSWDKLHSRCIEYPFAASMVKPDLRILDVGSAKADKVWIDWLSGLNCEVYVTDFDEFDNCPPGLKFIKADVRKLPIEDNYFDIILAVSVIEHIGLEDSQVNAELKPLIDNEGDIYAIEELSRVLKRSGKLVMTLPFGTKSELILDNSTRSYNYNSLLKFNEILDLDSVDYYEYQWINRNKLFKEYITPDDFSKPSFIKRLKKKYRLRKTVRSKKVKKQVPDASHFGLVTWRRVPIEDAVATHYKHTEGVVCGVWNKK